jgi:hypothetical protein
VALAAVLAALLATPALGAVSLGGSPLNVTVGERGQLQAFRVERTVDPGIFYHPQQQLGDAGFFLAFPATNPIGLAGNVFGFDGTAGALSGFTDYTTGAQNTVTGSGSAADPLKQVSTYSAGPNVLVTQTTTYVNGSQEFRVHWDVKNQTGTSLTYKAFGAADFFFEGDDAGTGIFTQGPPRFVGGTNVDSGSSGGFVEVSPTWTHYQALNYPDVWNKLNDAADTTNPVLDDTILATPDDNAGAVEWDDTLANNTTKSYEIIVRSAVPSALQLNPTNAASRQGVPVNITATALDSTGQPYAGRTLRYSITGANSGGAALPLGPTGTAVITDPGTNPGTDTVVVFVDFNDNGLREPAEPQASALATFVDNVPPTCTLKASGTLTGGGASGKPLTITVNCGEAATVSVATTLTAPAARRAVASAKKKRKAKKIKLKPVTQTVAAGQPTALRVKIPKSVARKYAGKTLTATMVITAHDAAGNVKKTTVKRKVKLAKLKKKHR